MPIFRPKKVGIKVSTTPVSPPSPAISTTSIESITFPAEAGKVSSVEASRFKTITMAESTTTDDRPHLYYRKWDRDGQMRFYCTSLPKHLQVAFMAFINHKFTVKKDDSSEFCFTITPKSDFGPMADAYASESHHAFVIEVFKHLVCNKMLLQQVKMIEAKGAAPAF